MASQMTPGSSVEYLNAKLFSSKFLIPASLSFLLRGHTLLVNRLDYATSGLLVVALTPEGAAVAGKAFQKRDAQKFYLAILRGHVKQPYIHINEPIGEKPDPEQRKLKMATTRFHFVHGQAKITYVLRDENVKKSQNHFFFFKVNS